MAKKGYKHITQETFNKVKALINAKISCLKVREVLGLGETTVSYIARSDTFEDYKKILDSIYQKTLAKKANGVSTPVSSQNDKTENGVSQDTTLEILRGIHHEMKRLADAWLKNPIRVEYDK